MYWASRALSRRRAREHALSRELQRALRPFIHKPSMYVSLTFTNKIRRASLPEQRSKDRVRAWTKPGTFSLYPYRLFLLFCALPTFHPSAQAPLIGSSSRPMKRRSHAWRIPLTRGWHRHRTYSCVHPRCFFRLGLELLPPSPTRCTICYAGFCYLISASKNTSARISKNYFFRSPMTFILILLSLFFITKCFCFFFLCMFQTLKYMSIRTCNFMAFYIIYTLRVL